MYFTRRYLNLRLLLFVAAIGIPVSTVASEISAFTEPYRDIELAASESGTIAAIHVKEGDRVTAGESLATLDDQVLQASLKMAEAAMQSQGRVKSALAELRMHTDRLEKFVDLRERNHASQNEVDRTKAQAEVANANLEAVRDELNVKAIEYQRIIAQLQSRQIVSPIDGIVTMLHKDVGEFVSTTDPVVAKVVQLDSLLVVFSAPMTVQDVIAKDETLSVIVGEQEQMVVGTVEYVSPTIDAQSGTVRIKVRLPNPDGKIKSGAPCRVQLPGDIIPAKKISKPPQLTTSRPKDSSTLQQP